MTITISIITTGIIIFIIAIIMVSYNGHNEDNVHGNNDRAIAILTVNSYTSIILLFLPSFQYDCH